MERDDDHFDIDDEFVAESDEEQSYDRFIEPGRRARPSASAAARKGMAAWCKLEYVVAERGLKN